MVHYTWNSIVHTCKVAHKITENDIVTFTLKTGSDVVGYTNNSSKHTYVSSYNVLIITVHA